MFKVNRGVNGICPRKKIIQFAEVDILNAVKVVCKNFNICPNHKALLNATHIHNLKFLLTYTNIKTFTRVPITML